METGKMASIELEKLIPYMDEYLKYLNAQDRGEIERPLSNKQEDYKRKIASKAVEVLDSGNWIEDEIGKGSIGEHAIKAVQRNQNLIGRFQVSGFSDKVRENLSSAERLLFDLYHDHKEKECFDRICTMFGRKYDLVAYLYFILDPERYLPVRSSIFDTVFRTLGIDLQLTDHCSWDNYQEYLETVAGVRDAMKEYFKLEDTDLLDAHSFLWTMHYDEFKLGLSSSSGAFAGGRAKVGSPVFHKEYGEGRITRVTDENIYVDFNGKMRIFPYPEAFERDYLTSIN